MKLIDTLKKKWNSTRLIKASVAFTALIAYLYTKENAFIVFGLIVGMQALFNLSCSGTSCSTGASAKGKKTMTFDTYKPENK